MWKREATPTELRGSSELSKEGRGRACALRQNTCHGLHFGLVVPAEPQIISSSSSCFSNNNIASVVTVVLGSLAQ